MIINFFGRRGSGKTTAIRGNIKHYKPPVVIIDILGNYSDPQLKELSLTNTIQTKETNVAIGEISKYYRDNIDFPNNQNKIIVLQSRNMNLCADYLSAALWEIGGGTLVCDEVDEIQASEAKCFTDAIRYGRNAGPFDGIHLITGCRRPAELGPLGRNLTASANKFYCFGSHDSRDADFFAGAGFGDRAYELMNCPRFSGLFLDYDAQIIGRYHIDRHGNIFHDETATVENQSLKSPDLEDETTALPEGGPSVETVEREENG